MPKITLDTDVIPVQPHEKEKFQSAIRNKDIELAVVSVTEREMRGTPFEVHLKELNADTLLETAVWGESSWGTSSWGGGDAGLEDILKIISNGSFPKDRSNLSLGQLHQLRDAMILEAHLEHGREIFVSNDQRAFVGKGGKIRAALEEKYNTKIVTLEEFYSLK